MLRDNSNNSCERTISLKYCSCCLKKFCPKPEDIKTEKIRFFVPTLDASMTQYFAYIEVTKEIIEFVYAQKEKVVLNLSDVATLLHVETGKMPCPERAEEIVSFYDYESMISHQYNLKSFMNPLMT